MSFAIIIISVKTQVQQINNLNVQVIDLKNFDRGLSKP